MERIDKIVAVSLNISRKEAAQLIRHKQITANGICVKSINDRFDEYNTELCYMGKELHYSKYVYIMMNKPKGVISASEGSSCKTVIDILPDDMKRKKLFPAGRLDKDTTGFMLITDDGEFAHRILSPKNHIPKTYIATLDKAIDDKVIEQFAKGVELKDDICMPAELVYENEERTICRVTIRQGMYHQIKRMFAKYGAAVTELKRIKMGSLLLDDKLSEGECRYITQSELELIEK